MRQADLFSVGKPTSPASQSETPDPDAIRTRLHATLAEVQAARTLPWEPVRARVQETVFHNMANWLPEAERDQLRRAFAKEIARLR
jgi:23S rRNA maturation mini-RNase III